MITRTIIILILLFVAISVLGCCQSCTSTHEAPPAAAKVGQGTHSLPPDIEVRAKEIATRELDKWVKGASTDAEQIGGATVSAIKEEGNLIHVIMMKDVSARDKNGRVLPEGMHKAYFHVFLDTMLRVVKVERGPDEIS